jgi:hypothetical protein
MGYQKDKRINLSYITFVLGVSAYFLTLILSHKIFFFRLVTHSFYKSQVNIHYQSFSN